MTKSVADTAAKRMTSAPGCRKRFKSYQCPICRMWHLKPHP